MVVFGPKQIHTHAHIHPWRPRLRTKRRWGRWKNAPISVYLFIVMNVIGCNNTIVNKLLNNRSRRTTTMSMVCIVNRCWFIVCVLRIVLGTIALSCGGWFGRRSAFRGECFDSDKDFDQIIHGTGDRWFGIVVLGKARGRQSNFFLFVCLGHLNGEWWTQWLRWG